MSSKIEITRICEYCQTSFIARTTKTRYCSKKCNGRSYKDTIRKKKISESNQETKAIKEQEIQRLKTKELLTVSETAKVLGVSRQSVYNMMNKGKLPYQNNLERKTRIRTEDIDKLQRKTDEVVYTIKKPKVWEVDISQCYTTDEAMEKFGISRRIVLKAVELNNIPHIKIGWHTYIHSGALEKIFRKV